MKTVRVRRHSVRQLVTGLESGRLWERRPYPISRARLLSQLRNPCVREEDVALVTARRGDELVGYVGAIPDRVHPDRSPVRMGWATCWWVADSVRGTGLGKRLMTELIEAYGGRVCMSSASAAAQRVLRGQEGLAPFHIRGVTVSVPRLPGMGFLRRALKSGFFVDYDTLLDPESARFVESVRREDELARRSVEQLNWILSSPWKVSGAQRSLSDTEYFFSLREDSFCWSVLKVHSPDRELAAVLLLKRFGDRLNAPYVFIRPGWEGAALRALLLEASSARIRRVQFADPGLLSALRRFHPPRPWCRPFELTGFLSERCGGGDPNRYHIHLGDGDNAFT